MGEKIDMTMKRQYKFFTQQYIQSILDYDPTTGLLTWRNRADKPKSCNSRHAGKVAGSIAKTSRYWFLMIDYHPYAAHRIIWLHIYGRYPNYVDHKNLDRSDNRLINLRECTPSQNRFNTKPSIVNKSGYKNVSFNKLSGKWRARMSVNGKRIEIGQFGCPTAAHFACFRAAKIYHGEFARQ